MGKQKAKKETQKNEAQKNFNSTGIFKYSKVE